MDHRNKPRATAFVPLLLAAVLALPAWAAPSGKTGHYPGQKCVKCHVDQGKPGKSAPSAPAPGGGKTESGPQSGAKPPQGGSPAK